MYVYPFLFKYSFSWLSCRDERFELFVFVVNENLSLCSMQGAPGNIRRGSWAHGSRAGCGLFSARSALIMLISLFEFWVHSFRFVRRRHGVVWFSKLWRKAFSLWVPGLLHRLAASKNDYGGVRRHCMRKFGRLDLVTRKAYSIPLATFVESLVEWHLRLFPKRLHF